MIDLSRIKSLFLYLSGSMILVLTGFLIEKAIQQGTNFEKKAERFQEILHRKEGILESYVDRILDDTDSLDRDRYLADRAAFIEGLNEEGLAILIYEEDTLVVWTDHTFPIPQFYSDTLFQKGLVFQGNAWFRPRIFEKGNRTVVGLIMLKHEYPYENKFLRNDFQRGFNMPPGVALTDPESQQGTVIFDQSGNSLFSLDPGDTPYRKFPGYLISGFYFAGLILMLLFISKCLSILPGQRKKRIALFGLGALLVLLNFSLVIFRVPTVVFSSELFSPYYFANSQLLGSLGNFFITSVFILFFFAVFSREFSLSDRFSEKIRLVRFIFILFAFLLAAIQFSVTHYLFQNVLLNSSISFEPYKVLDLSFYSMIGFISISLIFISVVLFINKIVMLVMGFSETKYMYISIFVSLVVFPLFSLMPGFSLDVSSILMYLLLVSISIYTRANIRYHYSSITVFVFLFALYAVYEITSETRVKEKSNRKVLAVNLGAEHDPVAELLFDEVNQQIQEDEELARLLRKVVFSIEEWDEIYFYLRNNYFQGYWERYDLVHTICNDTSSILVNGEQIMHCITFFNGLVEEFGDPVPGTRFYYLNNQTGNVSYYGAFRFNTHDPAIHNYLFIELDSRLVYSQLGYPELLLDEKLFKPSPLDEYSYAKYYNQELIAQSGDFPYSLNCEVYGQGDEEFTFFSFDGYDHLMYRVNPENSLIISKPEIRIIDIVTSFSYLFVFLYLIMGFFLLVTDKSIYLKERQFNFKMKIEFSLISILLLALIMIGGGAIYFSIQQYKTKHYENLSEKIRSVYVELEHKLVDEEELTSNWSTEQYASLNDLLVKFSNVFYSDINLYDESGNLLATSRPELFDKSLMGKKINHEAYWQLEVNKKAEYVHNEVIGDLKYLSAYVPFINRENKLLAYLNLPYFTQQSLLAKEISNLVVAIVNFSVLLILLTIALAVIISTKITNPLRLIQKKFSNIELGKLSEHISYSAKDEIGNLVSEYNRMVDELTRSVELLARSERESAWREMAKQIAHEIKNPLTPMKLSVQQLQRSWKDKSSNWEESLNRFSKTLIDQIDNLSTIATAFSDFAKMPKTNNEVVDVVDRINDSVGLFENIKNVEFQINLHGNKKVPVFTDKEQLLRVFANLIKNAIQSIPAGRKGLITIDLLTRNGKAVIKVSDNGSGIPEELGDKLFMPNFTTKSSGMGLGLAIVKNIIEDANGTIRYETEIGKGTTFIVELLLYKAGKG